MQDVTTAGGLRVVSLASIEFVFYGSHKAGHAGRQATQPVL